MRITLVTEYLAPEGKSPLGGVDALTLNLARQLAKNNDVHIVTCYLEGTERLEKSGLVTVHRVGQMRQHLQRGDFLKRIYFNNSISSTLQMIKPDIVNALGLVSFKGSYEGAKKLGVPCIATVAEVWQGEWIRNMGIINALVGHFVEKAYFNYPYDKYIAISNFTKDKMISKLHIPEDSIDVIYCGVDTSQYESVKVNGKYENPTILTICRLVEYKHVDDLIRAIKLLSSDFPEIHLNVVGVGPKEGELKSLAAELEIGSNITFMGKIDDNTEMIEMIKKSHVFALPSVVEGFGIVTIEAMVSGTPYVASDILPIREVTNGGIGGLLSKPRDYGDLAEKLKELLVDEGIREEKIREGKIFAQKYDWRNICQDLEGLYKSAIMTSDKNKLKSTKRGLL